MPLRTPEECYAPRLRPYHPCRGEDRPATRVYKHSTPGGVAEGGDSCERSNNGAYNRDLNR
jgi:hypothetical protein